MKVPFSWLKKLIKTDRSVEVIADRLTMAGIEVETIESFHEPYEDFVLNLAILANIARCQSMLGVAREVAALTGDPLEPLPELAPLPDGSKHLKPTINDPSSCSRFSLAVIDGIEIKPSPPWIQQYLILAGIQPINNVVDLTNYVMLELGQPMHAYDLACLTEQKLAVRLSRSRDRFATLSEPNEEKILLEGHPVITCADQVVALAGVIGGAKTAISETTTSVLLESANFDLIAIRRSQSAMKLYTDASIRFSRGVDPSLTLNAIQRWLFLIKETCPTANITAWGDEQLADLSKVVISLSSYQVNATLGLSLTTEQIVHLLERVGLPCNQTEQPLK